MVADRLITFAYGSNMLTVRMQERCPSAQPVGMAELCGYALRWHKKSRDGSGKCDIAQTDQPGASVFGVLYEIAGSEKAALDKAEGLGFGYDETEIEVLHGADRRRAKAYTATAIDPALEPYSWYRALVIAGARDHGLPASYVRQLEGVPTIEDGDRARHDKNMALIGEVQA